jgi:purine-binding chemotaxis protein CheW
MPPRHGQERKRYQIVTDDNEILEDADTYALKGRFLTFLMGKEIYGIGIRYVTEIVGIQPITEMPEMPDYQKGIMNLRGQITPVMDVRLRFGMDQREYDDRTCVIVIELTGVSVGLIVDSVSEVLTLSEENIAEVPRCGTKLSNGYVKSIGKAGSDVILLLDCEKLLSNEDITFISEGL